MVLVLRVHPHRNQDEPLDDSSEVYPHARAEKRVPAHLANDHARATNRWSQETLLRSLRLQQIDAIEAF